ncbi:MAG: alcohol dehydrogenase catalytic domain-containing protein [Planctomycetes bacterium]|nr:alcohol dehydrogenase catalytic domain-containing protein [Planctomycetota bacterium]MBI3844913.1 alcohol dehydrogenase catalytic domain-containing protein [Planctomycetota bacterium]
MKAMVVRAARGPLTLEKREVPKPGPGQVRVRVHACGVCHSDVLVHDGIWPGLQLPRVPGHEIAGTIDAVGAGVTRFEVGRRVGIGWHGGYCNRCNACAEGDHPLCEAGWITAISSDGGYAEYVVADSTAVAIIPDEITFADAAPLLCAGVTTFNALRHSPARPGNLVAIQGIGGLGHLGVQFARAMGFRVAALTSGRDKAALATKLGANLVVDTKTEDVTAALQRQGGASVILATAPDAASISKLVPALGRSGTLVVVAAPLEPMQVSALDLIGQRRRIQGWPSGDAQDSTETMAFAALHGIRPMIETFPLERANDAYAHMLEGRARFRAVIEA